MSKVTRNLHFHKKYMIQMTNLKKKNFFREIARFLLTHTAHYVGATTLLSASGHQIAFCAVSSLSS